MIISNTPPVDLGDQCDYEIFLTEVVAAILIKFGGCTAFKVLVSCFNISCKNVVKYFG